MYFIWKEHDLAARQLDRNLRPDFIFTVNKRCFVIDKSLFCLPLLCLCSSLVSERWQYFNASLERLWRSNICDIQYSSSGQLRSWDKSRAPSWEAKIHFEEQYLYFPLPNQLEVSIPLAYISLNCKMDVFKDSQAPQADEIAQTGNRSFILYLYKRQIHAPSPTLSVSDNAGN